jgi:cell surface protein SprA
VFGTKLTALWTVGALAGFWVFSAWPALRREASPDPGEWRVPLYAWTAPDSADTGGGGGGLNDSLPYPFDDREGDHLFGEDNEHAFDLGDPSGVQQTVTWNPETGEYEISEQIGGLEYRDPAYYSFDEFIERESRKSLEDYWQERSQGDQLLSGGGTIPELYVGNEFFCRLFGGCNVDIRPSGNIDLTFGGSFQNIENPILTERQRRQGGFDFDMGINMSVLGKIGEKLKLTTNYNTEATFNFENQVKLEYAGFEDDIVQAIEAGNVSLPLTTTLIPGTQSLFGIKTKMQFGRLTWTNVMSQQRSQTQSIQVQGGAQRREFEIFANEYDAFRHYFLGHYFRDNYEDWLSTLPFVNSPAQLTRIEVWVTNNTGATVNTRDIVAFADLGEADSVFWRTGRGGTINPLTPGGPAGNYANDLYQDLNRTPGARSLNDVTPTLTNPGGAFRMQPVRDFEKVRARKLQPNEYTLNNQLGYLSINSSLQPDDVLAVAYEYTLDGRTYQVGEFTDELPPNVDSSNVIFLKLLKPTSNRIDLPMWDLMMKNVYSFGGFQISPDGFRLNVVYQDPGGGFKRYIPAGNPRVNGKPLITLLNLDNLNNNNDPLPDGVFDFISGITILPQTGRVIFPVLEPFGDHLRTVFVRDDGSVDPEVNNYAYDELYSQTPIIAEQFPQFNRFVIEGEYKSAVSNEIYLGTFNLPRGSVTVTAGGQPLRENVDYTIDYNLGRVKIINESILNSGLPINVNFENNNLFGFNIKSLTGSRFDYWINDNFTLGATVLRLSERPFTQKVNVGDDPIRNRMLGFDLNYSTEAPWLTRALDALPLYDTKETSTISVTAEVANFKPGSSRAINQDGEGVIFLDDFEGSRAAYDLRFPFIAWEHASTPNGVRDGNDRLLFPEAMRFDNLDYGKNRARTAWYTIDPLFLTNNAATPDHIGAADQSSNFVRQLDQREIFPTAQFNPQTLTNIASFDLAYYPSEPGPYNFDASPSDISAGLNPDGTLRDPASRWGGIMRDIETNDFEAANIEFVEFWLLDPYLDAPSKPVPTDEGELYINLGNVSEDVLKDSRLFFENGLDPQGETDNLDETNWGFIPRTQPIVTAFDNDPDTRPNQDKGLDGLDNDQERNFYQQYLNVELPAAGLNPDVLAAISNDPARDDYHYYRGSDYDAQELGILERYKRFNNPQGNSPTSEGSPEPYATSATNLPNTEDLNRDFTLNETEAFFSYRIPIKPDLQEGDPYVTSVVENLVTLPNGEQAPYRWIQFKVPVTEFDQRVGNINDFRSVRFIRMFLTGFEEPIVLRFGRLELVRNQWRRYQFSLLNPGEYIPDDAAGETDFNISAVGLEENSEREPIPYSLPPNAIRESIVAGPGTAAFLQNEQALSMQVCALADGDARAIFKELNIDLRRYRRMLMNVHGEALIGTAPNLRPDDGDLTLFLRIGSDFTQNYYELEVPLAITDPSELPAAVNIDDPATQRAIWQTDIDFGIDSFVLVKTERNDLGLSPFVPYEVFNPGTGENDWYRVTVTGNPDLGFAEQVMIGIRNPKEAEGVGPSYCAEVWVNELRLSDIDRNGGWAALARMDAKLADLGQATVSANLHTIGFGTLEQKIAERYMDNFFQYDASINLNLGKFFPTQWGVQLPFYASINESFSNPEFDPYAFDIVMADRVETIRDRFGGDSARSYRRSTQDYQSITSINFTNVRIERDRKGKKPMPWNIENFDFTYAYSKTYRSDPITQYDLIERHKGAISYNFSGKANYISPFEKLIGREKKWLALIRDFNINPLPNSYGVRSEINRQFGEIVLRDIYGDGLIIPTYDKFFDWDRTYNLRWDLTKALKFDFNATNKARIDEPAGRIDTDAKRDSVWQNLGSFGRNILYNHTLGLSYTLPFKKIPLLDWMTVRANYDASVNWTAGARGLADTLGHLLGNTQARSLNGELNFRTLYNKIGFLKPYNGSGGGGRGGGGGFGGWGDEGDDWGFPGDDKGKKEDQEGEGEEEEEGGGSAALDALAQVFFRIVLGLKRVSVQFTQNYGTTIPGYMNTPQYVGFTPGTGGPGWGFLAGQQPDDDWFRDAAASGWISTATSLNQLVNQTYSENLSIKATVEPAPDLRIELNADRSFTRNHSEFFRNVNTVDDPLFLSQNPLDVGSFNVTFLAWNTLFNNEFDDNDVSQLFNQLEDNRAVISRYFGELNPFSQGQFVNPNDTGGVNYQGFVEGYGPYSQDVLIPAFLTAYRGLTAEDLEADNGRIPRNIFQTLPVPNWRVTYNGLTKIPGVDQWFKTINLSHGYTSTLAVNSYRTDLDFNGNYFLYANAEDSLSGNFVSLFEIPSVVINEQLSPLIGIDITTVNDITLKFDYKKSRTLSMNFVDYQLSENNSTSFTIGVGYRMTGFQLPFKWRGKKLRLENDLTFRFDMNWRDDLVINYRLDQNLAEPTGGTRAVTINPTIDYVVNNRLNIQLFFNRTRNVPKISNSFPVTNTDAGIKVRFTLTE